MLELGLGPGEDPVSDKGTAKVWVPWGSQAVSRVSQRGAPSAVFREPCWLPQALVLGSTGALGRRAEVGGHRHPRA